MEFRLFKMSFLDFQIIKKISNLGISDFSKKSKLSNKNFFKLLGYWSTNYKTFWTSFKFCLTDPKVLYLTILTGDLSLAIFGNN